MPSAPSSDSNSPLLSGRAAVLCASAAAAAALGLLTYYWRSTSPFTAAAAAAAPEADSGAMGQSQSADGYVVEIAPPKLARGWQALPQDDPDAAPVVTRQPWRITVNPQAEVGAVVDRVLAHRHSLASSSTEDDSDAASMRSDGTSDRPRATRTPSSAPSVRIPRRAALAALSGFSGDEYRAKVQQTADGLYGVSKVVDSEEAKCLVLMLELSEPSESLLKTLTTMSNLAAFTANQDLFRELGAVEQLRRLLKHGGVSVSVRIMLVRCVANMAVNATNQSLLQTFVPPIARKLCSARSPLERLVCVNALTNLSVEISAAQVPRLASVIPTLFKNIWHHGQANLDVLKLLVNLSCCVDLIPHMLVAKAPSGLLNLLNPAERDEILLRTTTLFEHVCAAVESLGISWADLCGGGDCAVIEMQTVYFAIFGPIGCAELERRLTALCRHELSEVRDRASRIAALTRSLAHVGSVDDEPVTPPVAAAVQPSTLLQL